MSHAVFTDSLEVKWRWGGSTGRSSSLAIVFLIMLLGGPSQIILGKYFFLNSFISSSLSIYDCLSVFQFVIGRTPFEMVLC